MNENLTVKEVYEYLGKLIEEGLGEMLGDGDCDVWVGKEYKRVARQLGLMKNKPYKNNSKQIDEFMEKRITQVKCAK